MGRNSKAVFQEAWEFSAKRVNAGKPNKDRIRFFLTDGTTKTFDIAPMRDDHMKDVFLEITLNAILNHPVEALLLTYEAWFVEDETLTDLDVDKYLKTRPAHHPQRREGVNFYYETADGIMLTALAEIVTSKKGRELVKFPKIIEVKEGAGRMSHFFPKAREYSRKMNRNPVDEITQKN